MKIVILLAVGVAMCILGFIAWITGGSPLAFIAGILLLGCIGFWGAIVAGILTPLSLIKTIVTWAGILCLIVIVFVGVKYQYKCYKIKAKAEAKLAENFSNCKNEETDEWVKIPAGFYRGGDGMCIEGTPPPPPAPVKQVKALVLENECLTPCKSFVGWSYQVRTDGDPIRIKYQNADWFDQPGQGDFQAPKGFQPGEAVFLSSDKKKPHVKVWVYKEISVLQQ
ncbi:MAG: hypothetical protein WCW93_03160 [Candidatus Paceibacterota bacterium]